MWGNNNYSTQMYGGCYNTPQYGQMQPLNGYGVPPAAAQNQQIPMRDDRIWVEGEEAARSYLVAAGCSAVLWDNNRDTIYFKQTDHTGRPYPMMILDFTVRDQNQKPDYVTRAEFQQVISALMGQTAPPPQTPVQAPMPETEGNNG